MTNEDVLIIDLVRQKVCENVTSLAHERIGGEQRISTLPAMFGAYWASPGTATHGQCVRTRVGIPRLPTIVDRVLPRS
eukprot:236643-Rhodomonas_salina.1